MWTSQTALNEETGSIEVQLKNENIYYSNTDNYDIDTLSLNDINIDNHDCKNDDDDSTNEYDINDYSDKDIINHNVERCKQIVTWGARVAGCMGEWVPWVERTPTKFYKGLATPCCDCEIVSFHMRKVGSGTIAK